RVMEDWLSERMSTQTVKFYGKIYGGVPDSDTEAWLQLQLEKMKKASGLEETTTTTTTAGQ
ncbi:MAG: hypothetical protein NTX46_05765, partial [Chloroflexi bacterium]|nr:hypothetical protein [Chloroflexota bacterium]